MKYKLHFAVFYIRLPPVGGGKGIFAMKAYLYSPMVYDGGNDIDLSFVPVSLRRRLSQIEKIALHLLNNSVAQQEEFRCVFASHWGEWQRTAKLILQVCNEEEMSPWGFSTSVHNATVGLFSLIKKNKESYTTVAADEWTLEMGILETLTTQYPVLFVFAEEDCPEIYKPKMESPQKSCGVSFFLSQDKSGLRSGLKSDLTDSNSETDLESGFQIEIDFSKNEVDIPLTFETMKRFLQGEISEIKTANFTLRRVLS